MPWRCTTKLMMHALVLHLRITHREEMNLSKSMNNIQRRAVKITKRFLLSSDAFIGKNYSDTIVQRSIQTRCGPDGSTTDCWCASGCLKKAMRMTPFAFCQTSKITNDYEWPCVAVLMQLSSLLLDTRMLPRAPTRNSVGVVTGSSRNIMRLSGKTCSRYRIHISDNGMSVSIRWWLTSEQCSFLQSQVARDEVRSSRQVPADEERNTLQVHSTFFSGVRHIFTGIGILTSLSYEQPTLQDPFFLSIHILQTTLSPLFSFISAAL